MSLAASPQPLTAAFDVALLDLDGVVYLGGHAIPHAADAVQAARAAGMRVAFVTNNASRTPDDVAANLVKLGVPAGTDDIVTSAQGAAWLLAGKLPAGAPVLVTGTDALVAAVRAAGLTPVRSADDAPAAVVIGFDPAMDYPRLAEAALAVRAGALFVATNMDTTLPSPRGLLPGNGTLVGVVGTATGREPLVAGKPQLPLHAAAVERTGARTPLVVGDRLDTDVAGAVAAGTPSLLVLTGVANARDVLAAAPDRCPTYLGADLRALGQAHPEVTCTGAEARCRDWRARLDAGTLEVRGPADTPPPGIDDERALDWLRAAATVAWAAGAPPAHVRVEGPPPALADSVVGW